MRTTGFGFIRCGEDGRCVERARLSDVLRLLLEQREHFTWYTDVRNVDGVSHNSLYGESKVIVSEWRDVQFKYRVGLRFCQETNSFQFLISHDKYFGSAYQISATFNQDYEEFELAKQLHRCLQGDELKPIPHNLVQPDGEWLSPFMGLYRFLTKSKDRPADYKI